MYFYMYISCRTFIFCFDAAFVCHNFLPNSYCSPRASLSSGQSRQLPGPPPCRGSVCLNFELVNFNNINDGFVGGGEAKAKKSIAICSTKIMNFYLQNFERLQ